MRACLILGAAAELRPRRGCPVLHVRLRARAKPRRDRRAWACWLRGCAR